MITVIAVEWGNYLGRATEYIDKLRAGVARHLQAKHQFAVLQFDEREHRSEFPGWFKKIEIFRPGLFPGRCIYLDLDSVITGTLDPLAYRKGAVHLKDWGWSRNVHAGGTLVWDAEIEGRRIWEAWHPDVPKRFENDQEWMTSLDVWAPLPKGLVVSYRYHCAADKSKVESRKSKGFPPGAAVVAFHGRPKPHEVSDPWVLEHWKL